MQETRLILADRWYCRLIVFGPVIHSAMTQAKVARGYAMTTVINIEGDSPYLIPHVDHIGAIAHGENVDLTMYVALPGHTDLEPVYVQLSIPAADALLVQLSRAVAETAEHQSVR
jgi:hypothetical protein